VIAEKGRIILLGRYPQAEHWRPVLATVLLLGLVVASCARLEALAGAAAGRRCWPPSSLLMRGGVVRPGAKVDRPMGRACR
jgi:hypothetical protein